jgi:hypothetical protein
MIDIPVSVTCCTLTILEVLKTGSNDETDDRGQWPRRGDWRQSLIDIFRTYDDRE